MEKRKLRIGLCLPLTLIGAAACNGPSSQDVELESTRSALTHTMSGALMPFGGQDGTCVAVVGGGLQVASCGGGGETFTLNGSALQTTSGQCVDIQFGNLAAGVIDVTTCNGTVNQKWSVASGEITSANTSDGQSHCLDVHFGSHGVGTQLDLAGCNGTAAQAFWTTGYTMDIESTFTLNNGNACECLDVLFDSEQAGTSLDDSQCNATNAQWFVLDTAHHIRLANNTNLCVGFSGPVQSGLAPVALETCNSNDATQQWYFVNKNTAGGGVSIANMSSGCLDVLGGNPANGTTVDDFTCNGTAAQLWFPLLVQPICIG